MSEIWQPSRLTRQQMEERRLAALPLLSDRSVPSRVIAERFGVAPSVMVVLQKILQAALRDSATSRSLAQG